MTTEEVLRVLDDLLETSRDGAEGFRLAANAVEDPELQRLLARTSDQRATFANQLEHLRTSLRPTSAPPYTAFSGFVQRGWTRLPAALGSRDDHAILTACRIAEEHARESFDDATSLPFEPEILAVIQPQTEIIRANQLALHAAAALPST